MTALLPDQQVEDSSSAVDDEAAGRSIGGLVATPIVLAAALAALFSYLHVVPLDAIEARTINGPVISEALLRHIELVAASTVVVMLIAVPLGVLLSRQRLRRFVTPLLALANIGQAVPSIGVLVLLAMVGSIGFRWAVVALVLVAVLPVLRNTMVGLHNVDPALIDAGRGMGLTKAAVLFRVELPLAVPVILAGARIALILNVGSATLATFTNAGGLGDVIQSGIVSNRVGTVVLAGSVLTAVLALAIDWLIGLAERFLRPRGL